MVLRPFGYEFWILPEIFNDELYPLYSFNKADDGIWGYAFRVVILLLIAYLFYEVSRDPAVIKEYVDTAAQSHDDIVSWGRLKLGIDREEKPLGNAITYDKVLLEDDADDKNETLTTSSSSGTDAAGAEKSKESESESQETTDETQGSDM